MTIVNRIKPVVNYRTVTTPLAPVTAAVGTTTMELVAQNNDRTGLIIVNTSIDTNVYLAFGYPAIIGGGLTLLPNIGWRMDEFTFCVDAVNAISDADGTVVSVQEFTM